MHLQRPSLRTSARALENSSAPITNIREMNSKMVLGWIVGHWRRKDDHPAAPGSESSPHATVVAVDVSAPPATLVQLGVAVHSLSAAAGVRLGGAMPPGVTVAESRCSPTDVGLGEEDAGDTGVIVGVLAGVEVGTRVAVNDGVAVGTVVGVAVGTLVGVDVAVAVGVGVAVSVGVDVEVGVGEGPTVADSGL